MKAFLLAAGKGTRLRPYTDFRPKCLMPIHGKTLLEIWIDLLKLHGVDRVLINTHHFADQVEQAVDHLRVEKKVEIVSVHEPELLGSGGTLLANTEFIEPGEDFLIVYADNLTDVDLSAMKDFHRQRKAAGCLLTMGLFKTDTPNTCGIATLNATQTVVGFIEKPEKPESNLANAGIYVATYDILETCRAIRQTIGKGLLDIGFHLLPELIGRMSGYEIEEDLIDIGTVAAYERALAIWPRNTEGDR